ncbi:gliding motility-associated C-terminal domain-containing protein [Chitinophaga sp. CF118]|uniref:gliding motility-associated C-terminal domain-containing protein n=1 Tax=Chitinophaga sp. CF118 TaxID=1884367 RepID=UPI0008E9D11C|nr:gliding motility-associated C-terminal domain-containing protein [Chitinophaga sp. CF118]SFD81662.1 gliding motility-associated C-terminal domain-containing protein [Chitinophaga sp. CF118]
MFRLLLLTVCFSLLLFIRSFSQASFTAPDTVCVNSPVNIQNTSVGASTYFWNFCSGSLYGTPKITNLGNVGGQLNMPSFLATAKEGNNYYAFVVNFGGGTVVKLAYGTSLLNTPVATNLGTFGGVIPLYTEGVQVVQDVNGWHVIVVGGSTSASSKIVKIDFGSSLANTNPVITDWGNIGGTLFYPQDLYIVKENNNWYGLTVNKFSNSVTRFSFGTDFSNPPVATNFGSLGNPSDPTGIFAIQENGNWYVFITNESSNELIRYDFGSSLANTPTTSSLGNPGNVLNGPRDLCIIHDCGGIFALAINHFSNDLVRLDFNGDITTTSATGVSLGNGGNLSFPVSISTIFREGNSLYALITNVDNNTLSRLEFNSCNNSSIASSTLITAPPVTYNQVGTYTVNLLTNESLPTQSTFCKNIVVMPVVTPKLGNDTTICNGMSLQLDAGAGGLHYLWNTGATTQKIIASSSGTYSVIVNNGGSCTGKDTIKITVSSPMSLNTPVVTTIDCGIPYGKIEVHPTGGTRPYTYYVNGTNRNQDSVYSNLTVGSYTVRVVDSTNCEVSMTLSVYENTAGIIRATGTGTAPSCYGKTDGSIVIQVQKGIPPFEYAIKGQPFQTTSSFPGLGQGTYRIYIRNAVCIDSVDVQLIAPAAFKIGVNAINEICERMNGSVAVSAAGGTTPYSFYWDNVLLKTSNVSGLSQGSYALSVRDANSCGVDTTINIYNVIIPPVHIMNHDTTINIGDVVQLNAVNAIDYEWTPVDGLSCTDCSSPFAKPLKPVTYIVKTVTGLNCIPSDTISIKLTYYRSLYAPNAFSPNGDGQNDVFRVKGRGVAIYNLTIYNRWGQLIYKTNDMNTGWNGFYQHELQPVGAYVYAVQYAFYGQESNMLTQKGTFTLIR